DVVREPPGHAVVAGAGVGGAVGAASEEGRTRLGERDGPQVSTTGALVVITTRKRRGAEPRVVAALGVGRFPEAAEAVGGTLVADAGGYPALGRSSVGVVELDDVDPRTGVLEEAGHGLGRLMPAAAIHQPHSSLQGMRKEREHRNPRQQPTADAPSERESARTTALAWPGRPFLRARDWTRTSTASRPHDPESCASTTSATRAGGVVKLRSSSLYGQRRGQPSAGFQEASATMPAPWPLGA